MLQHKDPLMYSADSTSEPYGSPPLTHCREALRNALLIGLYLDLRRMLLNQPALLPPW